ncbi:hypothetical protein [Speluncibacter jeojiensis]|uniref:Uncharacterized protein n=1 Tax=Speluncibacter jeojiensis TaxID=2710754 RepID=A0A9X4RDF0_9ACTN|nr:hypothetical protein [Corynebacteriales bacterium D3-21]
MTEGLDTHVAGDENSCHALAASMSAVAGSVQAGADAFLKARSSSEWVWASGDEFRTKVTAMSNTTDRVEDQCRRFAQALTEFANSLAAVKATMASIRARAVTGMLTVTGETIDFPTLGGASAMVVIDQIKLIAFGEALEGVAAARVAEANAHHALEAALARVTEQLATVPSDPSLVLGNQSAGVVEASIEASHKWDSAARATAQSAATSSAFTWMPDSPTTAAAATVGIMADSTGKGLEMAAEDAAKELGGVGTRSAGLTGKALGPIGAMLGAVPAYVGDVNGGMGKTEAGVSEFGAAGAGTVVGSKIGEAAGKAVSKLVGRAIIGDMAEGTLVGGVALEAAEGAAEGAAIGSVVPGVGTAAGLIVGAVVGGGVAWAASKGAQAVWDRL